ncbi:hypothetical protein IF1G_08833 [Cordyceps javanica]|uniref:Uncharacterized protein n=1 Tax=Cordyceps javanica TaxID=43265 RepID=A0A545US91_9HYPO|nr:hypothetical protein IF1G_08833 [Cordyceps javanica]
MLAAKMGRWQVTNMSSRRRTWLSGNGVQRPKEKDDALPAALRKRSNVLISRTNLNVRAQVSRAKGLQEARVLSFCPIRRGHGAHSRLTCAALAPRPL